MKFLLPNIFLSNIFCNIIFLCKLVFAFLSEYIFYKFGMKDYITFIDMTDFNDKISFIQYVFIYTLYKF